MRNIEFKAYTLTPERLRSTLNELGARLERTYSETDTYFNTVSARLKYRSGSDRLPRLIAYERSDDARARESRLQLAECMDQDDLLKQILAENLGVSTVVTKTRSVYRADRWLANVDELEGANFVELEVFEDGNGSTTTAEALSRDLMQALGIRDFDLVPWSYEILHKMLIRSMAYQQQLGDRLRRLVLIDGASGTGKSTVASALRTLVPTAKYVRRRTTRAPRGGPDEQQEYVFVSRDSFTEDVAGGEYLESKDFLFGMSYGLHWHDVAAALIETSHAAFGLINLGTIAHVRQVAPAATTILLTSSQDTIRRRLLARGAHSPEALQERLENAERAAQVADRYTYVIENHDGELDKVVTQVARIVEDVADGAGA